MKRNKPDLKKLVGTRVCVLVHDVQRAATVQDVETLLTRDVHSAHKVLYA